MGTQSHPVLAASALNRSAASAASAAPVPLRIVRADALEATPWKNGGGVTREIAAYPQGASLDTFVWRASVADVGRAGPFSRFAGVDRTLVLLAGAGMHLTEARGATHALMEPLAVARFRGEAALDAQLVDGPTRDFNLMVRRDRASATLQVWKGMGQHRLDADAVLVFCALGSLDIRLESTRQSPASSAPVQATLATLSAMDTLVLDAPRAIACEVRGDGAALALFVRYV